MSHHRNFSLPYGHKRAMSSTSSIRTSHSGSSSSGSRTDAAGSHDMDDRSEHSSELNPFSNRYAIGNASAASETVAPSTGTGTERHLRSQSLGNGRVSTVQNPFTIRSSNSKIPVASPKKDNNGRTISDPDSITTKSTSGKTLVASPKTDAEKDTTAKPLVKVRTISDPDSIEVSEKPKVAVGSDTVSDPDEFENSSSSGSQGLKKPQHFFDSAAHFDTPPRKCLTKVNPFVAFFNIVLAFGLIGALIAGYIIGLTLFDLGDLTAVGLYGMVLMTEYLIQLACSILNRWDVNRIVENLAKKNASARASGDCEKGTGSWLGTTGAPLLNPGSEVSIAVVGYREDEQAWRQCLRSMQTQTLKPKCIVGVVDGNDEPDINMAQAFVEEFESYKAPLIHLPILLSAVHRNLYFENLPEDTRWYMTKVYHWLTGTHPPGHMAALAVARQAVVDQVIEWDKEFNISSLDAVCFSQPHGHKRTAMFTAFAMSLYALRTRDAVFTTDSDTLVKDDGLDEMLSLLRSESEIGGVTGDVKIWNRRESLLARLCSARYWFAFNIERACQSMWRCVGCLSGPMSMYRTSDLETILGPWNVQKFGGKETTFGDDRHLTNQLLGHGIKTRYTHRTWCDSESPTSFVRWVSQQTRWSKSFYREAFWFPASFVYQSAWMLVEMTIQALYPFILIATVFHFLFDTSDSDPFRPVVWLCTMFAIALFKSVMAVIISRNLWLLLFSLYGFVYFFGLLPSKIYAIFTMNATGWGTSARSSAERKRGQSFYTRMFNICHLVIWYTAIFVGLGFFINKVFQNPLYFLIGVFALVPSALLYWGPSMTKERIKEKFGGILPKKKKKPAPEEPTTILHLDDESLLPTKPTPTVSPTVKPVKDVPSRDRKRSSGGVDAITPLPPAGGVFVESHPDGALVAVQPDGARVEFHPDGVQVAVQPLPPRTPNSDSDRSDVFTRSASMDRRRQSV